MQVVRKIMALDVGERRVGVAVGTDVARLAQPLTTLVRDEQFWTTLQALLAQESVDHLVIGLPRNLAGEETDQTRATRTFAAELQERIADMPISFQDEALTSRQAEAELNRRGSRPAKADIDALAATYILEDYFAGLGVFHA